MIALYALALALAGARTEEAPFVLRAVRFDGEAAVLRGVASPTEEEPTVWDGETRLAIESVGFPKEPPTLLFVVDASGSGARLLRPTKAAALAMLENLPDSPAGLVLMGSAPRIALEPTTDRAALARAFEEAVAALGPGRNGIRSAVALAVGLAAYHPRGALVVVTDGVDSLGPVESVLAENVARIGGAPIYGFAIGNRVETALLEDLAMASRGRARALLTPADLKRELLDLAEEMGREIELRVSLSDASSFARRGFRVGTGYDPDEYPLIAIGPWSEDAGAVRVEVLGPGGEPLPAVVAVQAGGDVVSVGLSGRPVRSPAGAVRCLVGVAPGAAFDAVVSAGEETTRPPVVLSGVEVTGPDLGRPDGLQASILTPEGEPVLELCCGETGLVLAGDYSVRIATRPPWTTGGWFTLRPKEVHRVGSPGMGALRIEVAGEGGRPLDAAIRIHALGEGERGELLETGRSNADIALVAGEYEAVIPIPRERSLRVRVAAGQTVTETARDYGDVVVRAIGPEGEDLDYRVLVRDPADGRLLATGRTGKAITLSEGAYDIEIASSPVLTTYGVAVLAGARTEESLTRFGALFVTGAARFRVLSADTRRWVGAYDGERRVILLAGDYILVRESDEAEVERPVTVKPQLVTRVELP